MTSKFQISKTVSDKMDMDFSRVFQNTSMASYMCDVEGKLTFFNKAAVQIWGRTPELEKESWCGSWKIFYPDGNPLPMEKHPMVRVLQNGASVEESEVRIQCPDGSYKSLLLFPQPLFNTEGKLKGACNTLIDITDQKKDHIKKEMLSAIVDSSEDGIVSKDLNGRITSWNAGAERIFGYSEAEAIGSSISMLIPEDLTEEEENIISSIKNGVRVEPFETWRLHKSGKRIPISVSISPVKDAFGRIIGASKVARDISEKIQVEEKKAMLSAIVQSSDDAIVSKNLDGMIMSWNRGAQEIFGYSEAEVLGKSITLLIPQDRLQEEVEILSKIRKGIKIDHFETIRKHKSGRMLPVSITVSPIKDSRGAIIGASKVGRDITARIEAQAALKKYIRNLEILNTVGKKISENLDVQEILQRITDASTTLTGAAFGVFIHNYYNYSQEAFSIHSGIAIENKEGLNVSKYPNIFDPVFLNKEVVRIDEIHDSGSDWKKFISDIQIKEDLSPVSILAVPVLLKSGKVIGNLFFGHPESGAFTAEHELLVVNIAAQATVSLENSKLFEQVKSFSDKKDEFIALVSHELKTPLTTIKGYLQVLSKKEVDKMPQLFLNKSLFQVERLNTLVEDLLNMSRIEAGQLSFKLENFDLKQMLEEIIETFSYSSLSHKIVTNLGQDRTIVKGDKQRIEQAILNLMTNAIKYSPKADEIFINLEVVGDNVILKVRDKGIGLTPDELDQLFTRFYRAGNTRGISGLGLGLYLTKQIIDRHDGKIEVNSEFGKGSEFSISLPLDTAYMNNLKTVQKN